MTKKYMIRFRDGQLGKAIIADCILETKARISILKADASGNMLIRFEDREEKPIRDFLKKNDVHYEEGRDVIEYDKTACIHCGHCISLCPTKVFSFDKDMKLSVDEEKCVLCGLCIDACPRRALKEPKF